VQALPPMAQMSHQDMSKSTDLEVQTGKKSQISSTNKHKDDMGIYKPRSFVEGC
jgi:hypothetical protein